MLGWTNTHLHRFDTETARYARPHEWDDDVVDDDRTTCLSSLPPRFTYVYDFGDNWRHDVEVLGDGGAEPGCGVDMIAYREVDGRPDRPPAPCLRVWHRWSS